MKLCSPPFLLCVGLVSALFALPPAVQAVPLVPAGPPFRVDDGGSVRGPLVGMDGQGAFTIVWSVFRLGPGTAIFARRYGAGGAVLGPPFQLNTVSAGAVSATGLVMNAAGEMAVVWTQGEGGKRYVVLRRFDAAGAPLGPELRLEPAPPALAGETFSSAFDPAVGMDGAGGLVVAWLESFELPGEITGQQVVYHRFTAAGEPAGPAEIVLAQRIILGLDLAVAPDGSFFLTSEYVTSDPATVHLRDFLFGPDGLERPLHPGAPCLRPSTETPRVAVDGHGHFLRTFFGGVGQEPSGEDPCIGAFGEVFRPDGTSPQGEIGFQRSGDAPLVDGAASGGFAVVLAAGPISGVPVSSGEPIESNSVRVLTSDGTAQGGAVTYRLGFGPLDDVAYEASGAVVVGERGSSIFAQLLTPVPAACRPDPNTLCLGPGKRFRAALARPGNYPFTSSQIAGTLPFADSDSGGAFWFFSPDNPEMVVQLLDRAEESGHFGVAYGGLTTLATDLVITDMATGAERAYRNPASPVPATRLDPTAFAAGPPPPAPAVKRAALEPAAAVNKATAGCTPGLGVVCLQGNRFAVRVFWSDPRSGAAGQATASAPTPNTGIFRIALPDEISVAVKILDARAMNGYFWVFVGALTDIALEVEIRDVTTGFTRHYRQAAGRPVGRVDTVAFR